MKNLFILIIIAFLSFQDLCADAEKEIRAPLKHVTVYPDRAQLSHETTVEIPSGKTILKLTGLSPYIDAQSISVKGYGEFVIMSVNQQNNYLENLDDLPEIKSIRSQIDALQIKVEDEKTAVTVLQEKEAFLVANRALPAKETTFTAEQFRSVMDLYTSNMDQVKNSIVRKNRIIKDYEKQIAALQKQLADKVGKQQLPSGEISVSVTSEKALTGRLTVSYVVSNAGWFPSYDIRVDDITKPVTIFYKANVFQNTGVSWKDVKLSFSNATPWIAGDVPSLDPWFIDFYYPEPKPQIMIRGAASVKRAAEPDMAVMNVSERSRELKEVEVAPAPVEKRTGETTIEFDITAPYTLESDGKVQTIEIQRTTTPAVYKYLTVPKVSPLAYLTGNITDWAKQSLISGEATLYFENTFVGKSFLNVNQMKDTLTISLGTDNSILVKREKRQDFTSKKTLGSNKTETYSFLITIRNNKNSPVGITVNDQLPVSTNSTIEVDPVEISGAAYNSRTGEIKWDLELKPQETRQLILTYSVKYPKDKTIILE
jgi:uncharacterized protein (TIGR02231 family)